MQSPVCAWPVVLVPWEEQTRVDGVKGWCCGGEGTQTAEQRAGAGLCAGHSITSLAISHQCWCVLALPGYSLDSSKET